jgi:hypothetical protein
MPAWEGRARHNSTNQTIFPCALLIGIYCRGLRRPMIVGRRGKPRGGMRPGGREFGGTACQRKHALGLTMSSFGGERAGGERGYTSVKYPQARRRYAWQKVP